jgi:transcriptional regulator with XRE-family HTH domain
MTGRQVRDEGAAQTALIMSAVKRMRTGKGWSAQRLAEEMTAAGVPWNTDIVVNLEHGRRKSLRVHELLALAYVLDAESPADLLVGDLFQRPYPVTPNIMLTADVVRGWCQGETGPLREWLSAAKEGGGPEDLAALLEGMPPEVREQVITFAYSAAKAAREQS